MGMRWRYTMEGELPKGVDPAKLEGFVRAGVGWNDSFLPYLRGSRVELATEAPSPRPQLVKE